MVIFYPFFFLYLLRRLRNIGGWYAKQWDNDCNCIIFMRVIESNILQTSRNLLESVKIFLALWLRCVLLKDTYRNHKSRF